MAGNTPHFDRLVIGGCHQFVAIIGERDTSHSSQMSFDDLGLSFSIIHKNKTILIRTPIMAE